MGFVWRGSLHHAHLHASRWTGPPDRWPTLPNNPHPRNPAQPVPHPPQRVDQRSPCLPYLRPGHEPLSRRVPSHAKGVPEIPARAARMHVPLPHASSHLTDGNLPVLSGLVQVSLAANRWRARCNILRGNTKRGGRPVSSPGSRPSAPADGDMRRSPPGSAPKSWPRTGVTS
jgi:hypothetical protein